MDPTGTPSAARVVAIVAAIVVALPANLRAQDDSPAGAGIGSPGHPAIVSPPAAPAHVIPHHVNPLIAPLEVHNTGCDYGDWSFETAPTVWTAAGNAFVGKCATQGGTVPAQLARPDMEFSAGGIGGDYWRELAYPIGVKGQNWATSYRAGSTGVPLGVTGELISHVVNLTNQYVSFLMGGSAGANVYVSIEMQRDDRDALQHGQLPGHPPGTPPDQHPGDYVELARISNSENSPDLKRYWFDIASLLGIDASLLHPDVAVVWAHSPRVRIHVVDNDTTEGGYINVDDFQFRDTPPPVIAITRNGTAVNLDPDHPVWGFADTHTHPAAHLGFGGQMIVGDPSLPLDQTYATSVCTSNHGGPIPAMNGKSMLSVAIYFGDPHYCTGAPDYIGYPRFNVKTYSGYHPDFFRRAWQGGERLVVALAVNNQYLATRAAGTGLKPGTPTDDDSQAKLQIDFVKQLVAAHSDFMEIALTSADARRIILSGKLAVVLGLELDTFGNFKDASYIWTDNLIYGTQPLTALSPDRSTAKGQLAPVIARYQGWGVRQVTGQHYLDGLFGGVPVMRPEPMLISEGYTDHCYSMMEGKGAGTALNILYETDDPVMGLTLLLMGGVDKNAIQIAAFWADCKASNPNLTTTLLSTLNAQGLTDRGTELFLGLMRAGMLIDTEHTSYQTKDGLIALAQNYNYPVMSSHTDPAALAFRPPTWPGSPSDPTEWRNLASQDRPSHYGTSDPSYLANEFSARDSDLDAIRVSGGTIGLFLVPWRKPDYAGSWMADASSGRVRNNNDGSSKAWAQAFLYTAERMNGHGVALASDRAGIAALGPRFGVYAAWALDAEPEAALQQAKRYHQRRDQAAADSTSNSPWEASAGVGDVRPGVVDKGVHYDVPIRSFHSWLYEFGGKVDGFEEDAWKALAYIEAFPTIDPASHLYVSLPNAETKPPNVAQKVPQSSDPLNPHRIENFVRGWHAPSEAALAHPPIIGVAPFDATHVNAPWEQAAFFALARRLSPGTPGTFSTFPASARTDCNISTPTDPNRGVLCNAYWDAKMVYDLWQAKDGDNAPLRRYVTGTRYWDFNLDGLANYGLLPDFLQDLRNVGINAPQMDALFESAEDYIKMWEKVEAASSHVPP
jgi:microsomal dipeptidase-like Zn-dependent dipeptidase